MLVAAVGLAVAFVLIWAEPRRHPFPDPERRRIQRSLSNAGYQNLRVTGAGGVMVVGNILYGIGPAAWPGLLVGGLLGLRSTLARSSYPSYLGMSHIPIPISEEELAYEEWLGGELQRLQGKRLIAAAMLPSWLELGVSTLAGWLFIGFHASAVQYLQVLRAYYRE